MNLKIACLAAGDVLIWETQDRKWVRLIEDPTYDGQEIGWVGKAPSVVVSAILSDKGTSLSLRHATEFVVDGILRAFGVNQFCVDCQEWFDASPTIGWYGLKEGDVCRKCATNQGKNK